MMDEQAKRKALKMVAELRRILTEDDKPHDNKVVIYSARNTKGKHDATGAFIPEAKAFAKCHDVPPENYCPGLYPGNPHAYRRGLFIEDLGKAFNAHGSVTTIAFFGHGWHNGIQAGFKGKHIPGLVDCLVKTCARDVKIILYACSTAENEIKDREYDPEALAAGCDGGFADALRDAMVDSGYFKDFEIYAHKTPGHTTWNPYVVKFTATQTVWFITPGGKEWYPWRDALKDNYRNIRYQFPYINSYDLRKFMDDTDTVD